MAFGKSVAAEPFDLCKTTSGNLRFISAYPRDSIPEINRSRNALIIYPQGEVHRSFASSASIVVYMMSSIRGIRFKARPFIKPCAEAVRVFHSRSRSPSRRITAVCRNRRAQMSRRVSRNFQSPVSILRAVRAVATIRRVSSVSSNQLSASGSRRSSARSSFTQRPSPDNS